MRILWEYWEMEFEWVIGIQMQLGKHYAHDQAPWRWQNLNEELEHGYMDTWILCPVLKGVPVMDFYRDLRVV
jgi:hypothetical protein